MAEGTEKFDIGWDPDHPEQLENVIKHIANTSYQNGYDDCLSDIREHGVEWIMEHRPQAVIVSAEIKVTKKQNG